MSASDVAQLARPAFRHGQVSARHSMRVALARPRRAFAGLLGAPVPLAQRALVVGDPARKPSRRPVGSRATTPTARDASSTGHAGRVGRRDLTAVCWRLVVASAISGGIRMPRRSSRRRPDLSSRRA
jgi:hypothetical protein